jgi:hypothetical protein
MRQLRKESLKLENFSADISKPEKQRHFKEKLRENIRTDIQTSRTNVKISVVGISKGKQRK